MEWVVGSQFESIAVPRLIWRTLRKGNPQEQSSPLIGIDFGDSRGTCMPPIIEIGQWYSFALPQNPEEKFLNIETTRNSLPQFKQPFPLFISSKLHYEQNSY